MCCLLLGLGGSFQNGLQKRIVEPDKDSSLLALSFSHVGAALVASFMPDSRAGEHKTSLPAEW